MVLKIDFDSKIIYIRNGYRIPVKELMEILSKNLKDFDISEYSIEGEYDGSSGIQIQEYPTYPTYPYTSNPIIYSTYGITYGSASCNCR